MKAKVLFENKNIRCRLVVTHEGGPAEPGSIVQNVDYEELHDFDNVSDLVNYCLGNHIEVPIGDCTTVESLD